MPLPLCRNCRKNRVAKLLHKYCCDCLPAVVAKNKQTLAGKVARSKQPGRQAKFVDDVMRDMKPGDY